MPPTSLGTEGFGGERRWGFGGVKVQRTPPILVIRNVLQSQKNEVASELYMMFHAIFKRT